MDPFVQKRKHEFEKFLVDKNYRDVRFNEINGALQATHIEHNFDKAKGYYEKQVQQILYDDGNKVILESERKASGVKTPDGTLNDLIFDIKAVEGNGKNNIKNKCSEAVSQGCSHLILYFPNPSLFNSELIEHGLKKYRGVLKKENKEDQLKHVWTIVHNRIIIYK